MALLTPAPVGTPGAAVASASSVANPTTLTPGTGSGYAIGDTLLCYTACRSATPTVATPAGWTSILNVTGTNGRLALFAKVAASTSEAAPSVQWSGMTTGSSGTPAQARVAAFRNLDDAVLASMADVIGTVANGAASTSTSAGGAALTTIGENDLVLSLTTRLDDAFSAFNAPAGFTNVTAAFGTTSGSDFAMGWAYQVKAVGGSVAAANFGLTGASSFASSGVMVALKAAAPVAYNDTCSGTISLSGSAVDVFLIPYSQMILATSGLVSYWRLDEASGNLLDSKGTSHATTVAGGFTRQAPGLLTGDSDTALLGDGTTGTWANVPANASLNTPAVTVELWVKPTTITGSFYLTYKFGNGGWFLDLASSRWRWYIRPTIGSGDIQIDTASAPADKKPTIGVRQHVVGTYSAADGSRLYVNGVQVAANAGVGNVLGVTNALQFFATSASAPSLPATLDEIAIYDAVLTPAQILEHYVNGATVRPTIYTDTCSGTISLSGSVVESWVWVPSVVYTDSQTGVISVSGTVVESRRCTDSSSGSMVLSGVVAVSHRFVDSRTGALVLSGTVIVARQFSDSRSGTIVLQGTVSESVGVSVANPIMMVV